MDPTGVVPKKDFLSTGKTAHNVALARIDPIICAPMYRGTCKEKNSKFFSHIKSLLPDNFNCEKNVLKLSIIVLTACKEVLL